MEAKTPLLTVQDLRVSFFMPRGQLHAVNGLSYTVGKGEILGIVGESGSGKSVQAYGLLGLLRDPGRVTGGSALFGGENLLSLDEKALCSLRGQKISMIFQNPVNGFHPVYTIGKQLLEAGTCHGKPPAKVRSRALELLSLVGIQDAKGCMKCYPHELSGGQQQRVMIAMALICEPDLLIADEPTTALDVTIQAQMLELLRRIQRDTGMSVLFITHNLAVVAQLCDRVAVMYAGRLMELGTAEQIYHNPQTPYTRGLLHSIPTLEKEGQLPFIPGVLPDPYTLPRGCPFAPRCGACMERCTTRLPDCVEVEEGHQAACLLCQGQGGARHG